MPRRSVVITATAPVVALFALQGCGDAGITGPADPSIEVVQVALSGSETALLRDEPLHAFQSPEPQMSAQFGSSVGSAGGNVLVGAPFRDVDDTSGAGQAYLLSTDGSHLGTFRSPEPQTGARFGWAVAEAGGSVVIGANGEDVDGAATAGRAYLFAPDGTHLTTFQSPEPQAGAWFGRAVAGVGENILVGAERATVEGVAFAGRAYLFAPDGSLIQTFQAPEPQRSAQFGVSVASVGENVLIGAWGETVNGLRFAGRAYLFAPDGTHLTTFEGPIVQENARLGGAVAAVGDEVLIGAPLQAVDGLLAGQIHRFASDGTHLHTYQSPEPQEFAQFGWSVGVVGEHVLVGANLHDVDEVSRAGQAYLFDPEGTPVATFQSPEIEAGSILFGTSVSAVGGNVVIGAPAHDVGEATNAGRAYFFELALDPGEGGPGDPEGPGEPDPVSILEQLLEEVRALGAGNILDRGQARSLAATLSGALASAQEGRVRSACNQVDAFINQVNAAVRSGRLTAEQADALIPEAEAAIDAMCG